MKITICSHDGKDYFGGPYEWVKRMGPALRERGIEVSFLFFSDHQASVSSTHLYLRGLGFECRLLPQHSLSQWHDNTEDRIKWCLQQVNRIRPDVFIANASLPALYAGKWIKASGIPVIGVLHTDDVRYGWMHDVFVNGEEDFRLTALVCVSQWLKEKTTNKSSAVIPIEVISCGTPLSSLRTSAPQEVMRIVYAGKLTEDAKQVSLLTKAFCNAAREIEGVESYIYGEGPSKLAVLDILKKEGKDLPVYYKGFVESHQIQKELQDKHVMVLLSDYEGLPIVLLEAMACGLVPVCLNIASGIPELVIHNETGLLVNDRDESFIAAIRQLKQQPEVWKRMSDQSYRLVEKEHAMAVVVQRWLDLSKRLKKGTTSPVQIPGKIVLPPVHALLKGNDQRKLTFTAYLKQQLKRIALRWKGGKHAV